jgi:prepilin-type N-terminal cleavage/methylation domain-containing protein
MEYKKTKKQISRFQKGFTIIELIVVIAIIAVLAAIVLVNVTQYINKGKDAAAEGNLATLLTNSAIYYDSHGNYDGFQSDPSWLSVAQEIVNNLGYTNPPGSNGFTCSPSTNCINWCASIQLKANSAMHYCVDSSGAKYLSGTAICQDNGTCTQ